MPIRRIAACERDARAPCLSLPISGLTSSRIAACGRDARAPRRAGDAPQCPAVAEPNLPRTQACCRWGHGMPCPNTPERPQVAPAEIYPIDRFDSTRTRCAIPTVNCSALRCCGRAVPESANPPLPQRDRAHVRCLPCACSRSFRSSESPVSALEMEVFRSVQREGSTSGFTTERPSAEPGRQTGTGDRLRPLCLLTVCACIVPSIIGDRRSRLSYTDAGRSATEEQPDAAEQDKETNPSEHQPNNW